MGYAHGTQWTIERKTMSRKGLNMTAMELVAREKKRAETAYINALRRTGATDAEIEHHEELVRLWKQIEKAVAHECAL